jgi:AraC-like DNA-binding protein
MLLRNNDRLLHSFKDAVNLYMNRDELANAAMMRAVYEFIYCAQKEMKKRYIPSNRTSLIAPAIEAIESRFTDRAVTVSALADMCGMSEVYFRRLFLGVYGVSPKEYIIQKRIEYAKSLLRSGSFSVAQTAELCGYAEPCHFSREFTKRAGVAPSRYILDLQHGAKI